MHESDLKSNPTKIKNEGSRFTILHSRSQFGFFDDCNFLLNSKNNDEDYPKNNGRALFQSWVNLLIPALAKLNKINV